jgi:hypothetical protein
MLQLESDDFALSVVVATNKTNLVETYVLADVQATRTFDLRLARFHLLRKPWIPQVIRATLPEESTPPPYIANGCNSYSGSISGKGAPSTHDDDGLGGGHVRSPSKVAARSMAGSMAPGSVTIAGGHEGSRGGETGDTVRIFILFLGQACSALLLP